jgi:serine/threonine-protein kinase
MSVGIPFGNYQLTRRLARGGMAEVFLATQKGPESFERTVAVKRILPHLADISQFVDMFMDEARIAAKLSHPNIAHIYEFGRVDDSYFIAMEYIEGIDLSVIILEGPARPLPFEHAARIIADVCAALHYAHSLDDKEGVPLGIVHRDISPQNILVSFGGAVKVVDFGIAKAAAHIERTRPGVVRGKFTYMSPEQVEGKPLDGRADLFCAGIVLYELCTCEALFPRTNPIEAMRRVRAADIPPPHRDGQSLPVQLERILRRALARRREERYRNAAEMQMDLEAYLRTASQISNSIILGEYFTTHYRKLRQQAAEAPEGTAAAKPATAKTVGPPRPPVSEEDKTLVVDDVHKDDLEQSTIRSPASAHAAGTIQRSDSALKAPEEQPSASGPYEPLQSDQLVVDEQRPLVGYDTIIPVPADEQRTVLAPSRSEAALVGEPTAPDAIPSEGGDTGIDTQMPTVPPTPLHAAHTVLFGTTIRIRSVGRRVLVIGLVIAVALAGVLVGYWLSNPGEPASGEGRAPTAPPDRSLTVVAPPRRDARTLVDRALKLATLHIQTKPDGASLTIDGLEVPGVTPLQHSVFAGRHTIVASYPEFEDRAYNVTVTPGEIHSVSLKLRRLAQEQVVTLKTKPKVKGKGKPKVKPRVKPKKDRKDTPDEPTPVASGSGFVSITTIPWSTVFLEEKKIGITPFANVKVPSGTHKLRFMDAKGQTTYRTVTIKPGEVKKLRFNLPGT